VSEETLLSRPSASSANGKCNDRLDVPLPESVKADFQAVALVLQYGSAAELARRLIEDFLYGKLAAVRMATRDLGVDGRNVRPG
jgi:hypothetical protein